MKPYVFKEENVRGPRSALRESVKKWRYIVYLYATKPAKPRTPMDAVALERWEDAVERAMQEQCGLCKFYGMKCWACPLGRAGHGCLNARSLYHRSFIDNRSGAKNAQKLLAVLEGLYVEAGGKL